MKSSVRGPLADSIDLYLAHKHSLGKQLVKVGQLLFLLDGYLVAQDVTELSQIASSHVEGFVATRPRHSSRSYHALLGALRGLFDWMVVHERLSVSPMRCESRHVTPTRRPFLFNPEQARLLLEVAGQLPATPRAQSRGEIYKMIFALLYGLGLRVGEVSRLCVKDIDLDSQLLIIRQTKFGKDRLVPFGPKMANAITDFLQREQSRSGPISPDGPVFSFGRREQRLDPTSSAGHSVSCCLHSNSRFRPARHRRTSIAFDIRLPSVRSCAGIARALKMLSSVRSIHVSRPCQPILNGRFT